MTEPVPEHDFDYIILGGGSAGYASASTAVRCGLRVAVVEGGDEVGGLCILRGCMPSKALLESAHRALSIRRAAEFGLRAEYRGVDPGAMLARKRRLIDEFASFRREQLESGKFEFIRGRARFLDSHTVEVDRFGAGTLRFTGRAFLVATGSQVNCVEVPGLREAGCMTSDDMLDSERLPRSVIVLGGGAIALEAASYYAGLGAEVTVIQRGPQLLKEVDADVAAALKTALEHRGIRIHVSTVLVRVEKLAEGAKRVHFYQGGTEHAAEAEEIIYALGRRPNTDNLDLERAGVTFDRNGIKVDTTQQTVASHIFAGGDVCGPFEVVHIAIQQGELAARNATRIMSGAGEALERMDYALKLFAVFTHPEVAAVGATEREVADAGIPFIEAKYPFSDHGKSLVRGEVEGFVKLIATADTRRILGAAVIGPEASELIHEIVVAMRFGATAGQLAQVPHYHPTLSEIWTYPAEALAEC